jgi:transposase
MLPNLAPGSTGTLAVIPNSTLLLTLANLRRTFTREFKLNAVRRLEMGVPIAEVARAIEVNPNTLHRWRREQLEGPGNAFPGKGKVRWPEGRIAELERKVGQQTLEIDFLKGCLQRIEEQRRLQALTGEPLSMSRSRASAKKPN